MATLEELVISLVAETSGLRTELDKAVKTTQNASAKMDDALSKFTDNSSKQLGFFETAAASAIGFLGSEIALGAVAKMGEALGWMKDQLIEGVRAAAEHESANVRLANSLAITGQYSETAMRELETYIDEVERLTGVDDTAVTANLALLSSLTRLDSEGLKKAQSAAIDLSAAMGIDLQTATMLVAKGVEGNTGAFKRYGITIQEGTSKTENLNNIVSALGKQVGGAAAGAMDTYAGALKGASNAYGDLLKAVGNAVVQNPVVIATLKAVAEALNGAKGEAESLVPVFSQGIAIAVIAAVDALRGLLIITGAVVDVFATFYIGLQAIKLVLDAIVDVVTAVVKGFSHLSQGIWAVVTGNDELEKSLRATGYTLGEIDWKHTDEQLKNIANTSKGNTFGGLIESLDTIAQKGADAFVKIGEASDVTTPKVKVQAAAVAELSLAYKQLLTDFVDGLAQQGMALESEFLFESELRKLNHEQELAALEEHSVMKYDLMLADNEARTAALAEQHAVEWELLQQAQAQGLKSDTEFAAARSALLQKQTLENKKQELDRTQIEKEQSKTRMSNMESTLGNIATLQQSSSKELQAIGKAAAIAQATIDGFAAVQKALAAAPPPYNFALAALVGTATAVNIAKIAGIGLRDGGTIAGGGANVDTIPATLAKGETVVTRGLTDQLQDFLNGQMGGGGGESRIVIEIRAKDNFTEHLEFEIVERQARNVSLLQPATT